jgi:hypothetical protein
LTTLSPSKNRFHCNRWFGRNIDDGSTERVLIGELLTGSITDILKKTNPTRSSSIGRNWTRSSEQYSSKEECLSVEDLQTMLGENVNQIMKYYFNAQNNALSGGQTNSTACDTTGAQNSVDSSHELIDLRQKSRKLSPKILDFKSQRGPTGGQSRTHPVLSDKRFATHRPLHHNQSGTHTTSAKSLINLIFGERKLLWILTHIFYYGYKNRSRSSFRKQSYLWDYLLRIVCELKISRTAHKTTDRNGELFIDLIDSITNLAPNYGKDSKFALFLLLSLR